VDNSNHVTQALIEAVAAQREEMARHKERIALLEQHLEQSLAAALRERPQGNLLQRKVSRAGVLTAAGLGAIGVLSLAPLTASQTQAAEAGNYVADDPTASNVAFSNVTGFVTGAMLAGSSQGVVGVSNTGIGVVGSSRTNEDFSGGSLADGTGVLGESNTGIGVSGSSNGSDGVHGASAGSIGASVSGVNTGGGNGVYAKSGGVGLFAESTGGGVAVRAVSDGNFAGVWGSGGLCGLLGDSEKGAGVLGKSTSGDGLRGESAAPNAAGVYAANAGQGYALHAVGGSTTVFAEGSGRGAAVHGSNGGTGAGIWGTSSGAGVVGQSTKGDGVRGKTSGQAAGVYGLNTSTGVGVRARSGGTGLIAESTGRNGLGLLAASPSGRGAQFSGGTAAIRLVPRGQAGAPKSGAHHKGDLIVDARGALYICIKDGTPGSWKRVMLA
jgi:hypothetical protein